MDYSLLKEIEPNFGPPASFGFRLSSTPSKDYVNPGVGQISRIYSLYIPMHSNNSPHLIEKVNETLEQEGEGESKDDYPMSDAEELKGNESDTSENNDSTIIDKKRKKMDEGIRDSFLHPKRIKIGEILLPKKEPNIRKKPRIQTVKSDSKVSHKFKIV
jgi:hypothetical protein